MKKSKELLEKAGIIPRLRLGIKQDKGGMISTGAYRVKVLEDKILKLPDPRTGKETEYVRYMLEVNGENKYYQTKLRGADGGLSYLVQRFAEIEEGEEVILEMKKRGIKNYVDVIPVKISTSVEVEDDEDDRHDTSETAPDQVLEGMD